MKNNPFWWQPLHNKIGLCFGSEVAPKKATSQISRILSTVSEYHSHLVYPPSHPPVISYHILSCSIPILSNPSYHVSPLASHPTSQDG